MDQHEKHDVLAEARRHVETTRESIREATRRLKQALSEDAEEMKTSDVEGEETKMVQAALIEHGRGRLDELATLEASPYFTRCDLVRQDEKERSLYIGKFSFEKGPVVSWTSPIAALRFEEPGRVAYEVPGEGWQQVELRRRDQYLIVDGKIVFLASESQGSPRELIYQEYLSSRQGAFMLPEILAQMEKAQDQVVRAHHAGPFVISGPAGSGKTTLALHRVAYLAQSPDTATQYYGRSIIIFVQDAGTKDYFSHLLPELGIRDVKITTFAEWAADRLELKGKSVSRIGSSEAERDRYEYAKLTALNTRPLPAYRRNGEFSFLQELYRPVLNQRQATLLEHQKKERLFDRYDLTALLLAASRKESGFSYFQEVSRLTARGQTKRQTEKRKLEYSLIVVDEFQNYLPQQLDVLRLCLKRNSRSILYVGDLAQQTLFGTVRNWEDVKETIHPERSVRLQKVYRNTRPILEYIGRLGYTVEIPEGIKEGAEVAEVQAEPSEELAYLEKLVAAKEGSLGIMAKDGDYLEPFRRAFAGNPRVHCLSIREAQGVEFDTACLAGISPESFSLTEEEKADASYAEEKRRINRDLLYVALTRAISELHVMGSHKLSEIIFSEQ